jgi:hypothetical protein
MPATSVPFCAKIERNDARLALAPVRDSTDSRQPDLMTARPSPSPAPRPDSGAIALAHPIAGRAGLRETFHDELDYVEG